MRISSSARRKAAVALSNRTEVRRSRDAASNGARVVAMIAFGSVVRRDDTEASDFDLLLVVQDDRQHDLVVDRLKADPDNDFMPLVMSSDRLLREAQRRPSFVAHVLIEGIELVSSAEWDDLRPTLELFARDRAAIHNEIGRRANALDAFRHVGRFSASPITVRSHLYSIARSLVIARLLEEGVEEFRWSVAFDRLAELHPDLSNDLNDLKALRPYYEFARSRRSDAPEPDGRSVEDLVASVEAVAE